MIRKRVKSSVIAAVGCDAATETLEIEFGHGDIYEYRHVAPRVFRALMNAPSKGRFLNARIRDAYPYARRESNERGSEDSSGDEPPRPRLNLRPLNPRPRKPRPRMH